MRGEVEPDVLERFREHVGERFGLFFDESKLPFLAEILRDRIERTRVRDASAYLRALCAGDARAVAEARALAERLTVNETYFFRYTDQWRAFAEHVLPARAKARAAMRTLRILSAGSSSGEEAYTIAMLIREHLPDHERFRVEIVGIDVSPPMIEKAQRGVYSSWSLRETPKPMREKYFRAVGSDLELDEKIRRAVRFEERNLLHEDPVLFAPESFDVVFCRNVTMYFPAEVTARVVSRIAGAMVQGGFLFMGHAETLRGLSSAFHLVHTHDTFYYERREGDVVSAALPARAAFTPYAVPSMEVADTTWVETIRGATERIASLASKGTAQAGATSRAAPDLSSALELLRSERFEAALHDLGTLPAESRADPDALLLRAVLLTQGGRIAEAAEVAGELLAQDELHAGAHYVMALCCEHRGALEEAAEHDRAAIYLDASFAMPHLHLGLLSKRRQDLPAVRAAMERALSLLAREDASRVLLFGGGFSREALIALCVGELRTAGGPA